jgi:hypothetical protein
MHAVGEVWCIWLERAGKTDAAGVCQAAPTGCSIRRGVLDQNGDGAQQYDPTGTRRGCVRQSGAREGGGVVVGSTVEGGRESSKQAKTGRGFGRRFVLRPVSAAATEKRGGAAANGGRRSSDVSEEEEARFCASKSVEMGAARMRGSQSRPTFRELLARWRWLCRKSYCVESQASGVPVRNAVTLISAHQRCHAGSVPTVAGRVSHTVCQGARCNPAVPVSRPPPVSSRCMSV